MNKRAGWRQRQARGIEEASGPGFIGERGCGMCLDFCDGWLSAYRLRKHMQNAVADGSQCRLSKALGKIRGHGHCSQSFKSVGDEYPGKFPSP